MRRLIVNGDDFGLTKGVNSAIILAHRRGILTSATIMAGGHAWQEAVQLAIKTPTLGVGVHLTLTALAPVLPPGLVPSLIDEKGNFRRQLLKAPWLDRAQIEAEWRGQIQRLLAAGLQPTHLDSHHHIHLLPPLMAIACRLAQEFGIASVRAISPSSFKLMKAPFWQKLLAAESWKRAATFTINTPKTVVALEAITKSKGGFASYLENIGPGIHELYSHPGSSEDFLLDSISSLSGKRSDETELLCSEELRALLETKGIGLVNYNSFNREGDQ